MRRSRRARPLLWRAVWLGSTASAVAGSTALGAGLFGIVLPACLFVVAVLLGDLGGPLIWPLLVILGGAFGAVVGAAVGLVLALILWWIRRRTRPRPPARDGDG